MANKINHDAEPNGNGNREKIRQAYISRFTELCRYAAYKTRNYEAAKDIVNDVFLKVLQNPKSIKDYELLPSFLYKCVDNACLDYWKHKEIIRKHEDDMHCQSDFFQQHDNETPLFLVISKEREKEILDAIEKLPEMCGKVLLCRLEGLSYKEIAEELGISVNTVRNDISDGTKKLRKYFVKK